MYNIPLIIKFNFTLKISITNFPDLLRSVIHAKALAKQLMIVPIFGDHMDHPNGAHYLVSIIDMKSKKITILDSMCKGKLKKDYAITIYLLLELTNLIFQSGSIEFEANDWKTVISSDCLQQNDGHNCGIFVILNLAAMFIGNQLLEMKNPEKIRHWIYEIVKNFKIEEVRMPRLRNLPIIKDFKIDKLDILAEPTFNYVSKIIGNIKNQKSNKKCSFKDCKGFNAGNDWTLCVKCRKFFHTEHDIFIQNDFELEICIFCQ